MFKHEHSGPLKCIQCGYLTYNRRKFISHVESLGDVHDNKCTQCNEVMNTFDEHILHLHQVSCFLYNVEKLGLRAQSFTY